jgi:hypothetical protein
MLLKFTPDRSQEVLRTRMGPPLLRFHLLLRQHNVYPLKTRKLADKWSRSLIKMASELKFQRGMEDMLNLC